MNYEISKIKLDNIREKYSFANDIIMKTAVQYIMEYGVYNFRNENFISELVKEINQMYDNADKEGKSLFVSKDNNLAILHCANELSEIDTRSLLIYTQEELSWSNDGGFSYHRLAHLLDKSTAWICEHMNDFRDIYRALKHIGFEDEEINFLFGYDICNDNGGNI